MACSLSSAANTQVWTRPSSREDQAPGQHQEGIEEDLEEVLQPCRHSWFPEPLDPEW